MSISTIGNVGADLARIQDKQNRQEAERAAPAQPGSKSGADTVDVVKAPEGVDLVTARGLTEAENKKAAESTLTEADLEHLETPQERVQNQAREALAAQTNKLPPQLLQLLNG